MENEESLLQELARLYYRAEQEAPYGGDGLFLISPLSELSRLYEDRSDFAKAAKMKESQLSFYRSKNGRSVYDGSLDAAFCLEDLGRIYLQMSLAEEAASMFKESLRIKERKLGIEDYETCKTLMKLANSLLKQNMRTEAEEIAEDAILRIHRSCGDKTMDTADLERDLGNFYNAAHESTKSSEHLELSSRIAKELPEEISQRSNLLEMARLKQNADDHKSAVQLCTEAIRINEANPTYCDHLTEQPWSILARSYYQLGQYEDAEKTCFKSIEFVKSIDNVEAIIFILDRNLSYIYEKWGSPHKAESCRQLARKFETLLSNRLECLAAEANSMELA